MTSVARFALLVAVLDDPGWAILDLIDPAPWTVNKTETVDPTFLVDCRCTNRLRRR